MVFPGRLSTGCHICRTRKVKVRAPTRNLLKSYWTRKQCDGAKPECRRCAQHGVKCTGYPDRFSFREYKPPKQSKVGKSVSSRSRTASPRPGSKSASPSTSENSTRDSRFGVVLAAQSPSNAPSICSDWQSVCNLMHQLVLPVHRSPCGGYLAFLPQLFQEKGDSPSLRYAILGVSYLTLSKSHSGGELQIKARKNYGACLNSLNQEISSQDNAVRDETLAACLLLSIFFVSIPISSMAYFRSIQNIGSIAYNHAESCPRGRGIARSTYGWCVLSIIITRPTAVEKPILSISNWMDHNPNGEFLY